VDLHLHRVHIPLVIIIIIIYVDLRHSQLTQCCCHDVKPRGQGQR